MTPLKINEHPVAPSAIKHINISKFGEPVELTIDQIQEIIHYFVYAAKFSYETGKFSLTLRESFVIRGRIDSVFHAEQHIKFFEKVR